jgi:hypothetical protein
VQILLFEEIDTLDSRDYAFPRGDQQLDVGLEAPGAFLELLVPLSGSMPTAI